MPPLTWMNEANMRLNAARAIGLLRSGVVDDIVRLRLPSSVALAHWHALGRPCYTAISSTLKEIESVAWQRCRALWLDWICVSAVEVSYRPRPTVDIKSRSSAMREMEPVSQRRPRPRRHGRWPWPWEHSQYVKLHLGTGRVGHVTSRRISCHPPEPIEMSTLPALSQYQPSSQELHPKRNNIRRLSRVFYS